MSQVIEQLLVNPDRKFIYVEQAYFQRWWREQTDTVQNQVKQLVASGQLEFINGGWVKQHTLTTPTSVHGCVYGTRRMRWTLTCHFALSGVCPVHARRGQHALH